MKQAYSCVLIRRSDDTRDEVCFVRYLDAIGSLIDGPYKFVTGQQLGAATKNTIAQLGKEGWRLCDVAHEAGELKLYFNRPGSDGQLTAVDV
jgi:hypothetical protein